MSTPTLDQIRILAQALLEKIDNMTSEDFSRGEDGPEREALRAALADYNAERQARDGIAFRDCQPIHNGGRGV